MVADHEKTIAQMGRRIGARDLRGFDDGHGVGDIAPRRSGLIPPLPWPNFSPRMNVQRQVTAKPVQKSRFLNAAGG